MKKIYYLQSSKIHLSGSISQKWNEKSDSHPEKNLISSLNIIIEKHMFFEKQYLVVRMIFIKKKLLHEKFWYFCDLLVLLKFKTDSIKSVFFKIIANAKPQKVLILI
jgi:hypothetical protein